MIHFCTQCGSPVSFNIPAGDNRPRHICTQCNYIHYENPRLVVGCLATWKNKILLCRRAIEPRRGYWTLPAGFMENGESTAEAAIRETQEEAGAHIDIEAPCLMVSLAHIDQVHLFYRGHLVDGSYSAGEESLEVALFSEDEIPWKDLAFRSVKLCLEQYLEDRRRGAFVFREFALPPLGDH